MVYSKKIKIYPNEFQAEKLKNVSGASKGFKFIDENFISLAEIDGAIRIEPTPVMKKVTSPLVFCDKNTWYLSFLYID